MDKFLNPLECETTVFNSYMGSKNNLYVHMYKNMKVEVIELIAYHSEKSFIKRVISSLKSLPEVKFFTESIISNKNEIKPIIELNSFALALKKRDDDRVLVLIKGKPYLIFKSIKEKLSYIFRGLTLKRKLLVERNYSSEPNSIFMELV